MARPLRLAPPFFRPQAPSCHATRPGKTKQNKPTMNTKHRIKTILPLVAVAMVGFTPAAQAATVELTSSTQLNLTGRDVLAAVNFWDESRGQGGAAPGVGHVAVGSIQGTAFNNYEDSDTGGLMSVAQGTLSMPAPKDGGREGPGELMLTGPDEVEAESLAGAGWFTQADLDMTFDFGAEWANTEVEVQLIGGGTSANGYLPHFDISWDGNFMGRLISHDGLVPEMKHPGAGGTAADWPGGVYAGPTSTLGPYLMTFTATTDALGDLLIEVDADYNHEFGAGMRDIHMRGVMVTAVPAAASTLAITSITSLGSGVFELTLKGENNTSYEFYSSTTLNFDTGTLVPLTVSGTPGQLDVTTDGSGNATVQMSPGGSANFVRAGGGP